MAPKNRVKPMVVAIWYALGKTFRGSQIDWREIANYWASEEFLR